MLDLGGFPALDVIIGLAFVDFLLSIVTSSLTEAASGVFQTASARCSAVCAS